MSKPLHALLVEDSARDAALLLEELERGDYTVTHERIETAAALKAALERGSWDIVFCDFTLPHFSGKAAFKIVKDSGLDLPFIYVSGTIGEETAVEAMRLGAHDYVMKGNLARLVPAVERELREVEMRKQGQWAEESMRMSELKYRRLFESLADAAFLIVKDGGRIIDTNPQGEKLLGRTRTEILGMRQSQLYAPQSDPSPAPVLPGARAGEDAIGCDRLVLRKDFSTVPVHTSASAIELYGRHMVLALFRDMTQERAMEAQLRYAQKMDAVGQLAGGVAHDFNNLLAAIRGSAELVLMAPNRHSAESTQRLGQVIAATERAANLTRQLLAFDRKQVMRIELVDLNETVANLIQMLSRIIGENVRIGCTYDACPAVVGADAGMIEQVLVSLAVNARDAMPRGGQLLIRTERMTFGADCARTNSRARPGEFISLSVTDSGTGIEAGHLPRIFEPFFTTKTAGKGAGLGLATAYGIVKQHQGWIEVSSRVGAGTTFIIYLPALPPSALDAAAQPVEAAPRGGSEKILLVEDEAVLRLPLRRVLENFGYAVLDAASAREALEIWRATAMEADLLLTDVVLPDGVTGYQLAEQLCAQKPALRVLFVSGYDPGVAGTPTDSARHVNKYFLKKPFPSRLLLETARRCLDEPSP
jgi:two-component system, cell cycle sensor histidine kinase and response regulator CckA